MKTTTKLFIAALAVCSLASVSQAQFSANVAMQSDYVWRGASQNNEDPSIQGGFDYEHESGFYAGIWGASVDFGGPESTEIDFYAGFSGELEGGFGYDVGIVEYTYQGGAGASGSDFTEFYLGGSFMGFGLTYSIGDEFGDNVEVSYGYDFDNGLSAAAAYGYYDFADGADWQYWTLGVSGEVEGIGWDLSYWDTDVDSDLTDSRIVLTISKSL